MAHWDMELIVCAHDTHKCVGRKNREAPPNQPWCSIYTDQRYLLLQDCQDISPSASFVPHLVLRSYFRVAGPWDRGSPVPCGTVLGVTPMLMYIERVPERVL